MAAVAKSAAQQAAASAQSGKKSVAAATPQSAKKSVAEEAASKAKQLRLQALRDKVQGAKKDTTTTEAGEEDKKKEGGDGAEAATDALTEGVSQLSVATTTTTTGAGLQSPTTGAWKATETGSIGEALRTVQSPTTSSWKPPAETSLANETFAGARIASASAEEIKKVESETAIKEEAEPDEEEEKEDKAEEKTEEKTEA